MRWKKVLKVLEASFESSVYIYLKKEIFFVNLLSPAAELWDLCGHSGWGEERKLSFPLIFVCSCSSRQVWSLQHQFCDLHITNSAFHKNIPVVWKAFPLFPCCSLKAQCKLCVFFQLCSPSCCLLEEHFPASTQDCVSKKKNKIIKRLCVFRPVV